MRCTRGSHIPHVHSPCLRACSPRPPARTARRACVKAACQPATSLHLPRPLSSPAHSPLPRTPPPPPDHLDATLRQIGAPDDARQEAMAIVAASKAAIFSSANQQQQQQQQ